MTLVPNANVGNVFRQASALEKDSRSFAGRIPELEPGNQVEAQQDMFDYGNGVDRGRHKQLLQTWLVCELRASYALAFNSHL